jgi:hypothetical protein
MQGICGPYMIKYEIFLAFEALNYLNFAITAILLIKYLYKFK